VKGATGIARTPSGPGLVPRGSGSRWGTRARWLLLVSVPLAPLFALSCSQEGVQRPADTPTNVIVAHYQPPEAAVEGAIELDGVRIDREWGSVFTPERPFTQVRMSAEEGSGHPGATRYVAVKATYTDTHLYLLLQWSDETPDLYKDIFEYIGPGLADPLIHCEGGVCDTTFRTGPQDSLLLPVWWRRTGEDDKVALTFQIEPVVSGGQTYAEKGCRVICHPGTAPEFGTSDSGKLDIWYWLAGRTNPIRNLFILSDDPDDPLHGLPGYLDDWFTNASAGPVPDGGWPGYVSNDPEGRGVPAYVYRRGDDDFFEPDETTTCSNRFGGECLTNNGVPLAYLWREYPNDYVPGFSAADTLNDAIMPDALPWMPGDIVPGFLLTYPSESRADVRGKGAHDEEVRVWTLEIARKLTTGDPEHDVVFDPVPGKQYPFTIAIFNASLEDHWGSEPQMLVFGER
jgi:hypothetical protein